MKKHRTKRKIVVIWVDAGTFNVIDPLLERGKIPTFHKIIKEGVHGTLISTIPPVTPTAWASLATGVNPGKHGVYDFWDRKGDKPTLVNSYSIRREPFWSMLNQIGKKVILINAPMTYPPRRVRGILITGLMTPGEVPHTYPRNFKKKLLREFPEYLIRPRTPPPASPSLGEHISFLEESYNLLKVRRDATLYLMENYEWDILISVFHRTDVIQHYFWKYMDPTHPLYASDAPKKLKEAIPTAYEIVDDSVQKILEIVDEDTLLIVMSDHGAEPIHKYFFINNYLRTIGILSISARGIISSTVEWFLEPLKANLPHVWRFTSGTSRTIKRVRAKTVLPEFSTRKYIDWAQTKAYSLTSLGELSVNRSILKSTRECETVTNYLIQKLFELRDPESGEKIVDKVFGKSQIYWGQYLDRAPDLVFVTRKGYIPNSDLLLTSNRLVEQSLVYSSHHTMEGILFMYGKELQRGHTLRNCNIMDLAPTILYALGLQLPSDLDGKVLVDAFHPSYVRKHPIKVREKIRKRVAAEKYTLSKEDELKIRERLKALGYLG